MLIEKNITALQNTVNFDLKIPPDELYIHFAFPYKDSEFRIQLYNPDSVLIGEVLFGYHRFVKYLYYSKDVVSINALSHRLIAGTYVLHLLVIPSSFICGDFPGESTFFKQKHILSIEISTSVSEAQKMILSKDVGTIQNFSFFDPSGTYCDSGKVINPARRFYKGDFHGHTTYSDGSQNLDSALRVLEKRQMDFMAFTEHNAVSFGSPYSEVLQIPSLELTLSEGHINLHGIGTVNWMEPLIRNFFRKGLPESNFLASALRLIRNSAQSVSLNHMFLHPWEYTDTSLAVNEFTSIEIICDPTYPDSFEANRKAVAFLDFLWNKGYRIYGIGGSDSHNLPDHFYDGASLPSIYGDPATWVFCDGLSAAAVLQGLSDGHLYVTRFLKITVRIANGQLLPGDPVPEKILRDGHVIDYDISVENLGNTPDKEYIGMWICNGEVIGTELLSEKNPSMHISLDPHLFTQRGTASLQWFRAGILTKKGESVTYVNPVYFGTPADDMKTMNSMIKEFDLQYDKGNPI